MRLSQVGQVITYSSAGTFYQCCWLILGCFCGCCSSCLRILPPYIRDSVRLDDIACAHNSVMELTPNQAILAFIEVLKQWTLFGAHVFSVSVSHRLESNFSSTPRAQPIITKTLYTHDISFSQKIFSQSITGRLLYFNLKSNTGNTGNTGNLNLSRPINFMFSTTPTLFHWTLINLNGNSMNNFELQNQIQYYVIYTGSLYSHKCGVFYNACSTVHHWLQVFPLIFSKITPPLSPRVCC